MSDQPRFGPTYVMARPINRTNEPDTCLWCGTKLRKPNRSNPDTGRRGDYSDGAFCGLRCGYSFGVAAAINGFTLAPYSTLNTEDDQE